MPQFNPSCESDDPDFAIDYVKRLANDLASLDFPSGELSDNKRVLKGIISFWNGAAQQPADLFIPENREEALKQMQSMERELNAILKRQSEHFTLEVVELGKDIPMVNNAFLISKEAEDVLANYIQELKKVHGF